MKGQTLLTTHLEHTDTPLLTAFSIRSVPKNQIENLVTSFVLRNHLLGAQPMSILKFLELSKIQTWKEVVINSYSWEVLVSTPKSHVVFQCLAEHGKDQASLWGSGPSFLLTQQMSNGITQFKVDGVRYVRSAQP